MLYQCRGHKQILKDPDTGWLYDMGFKPCGKSLDETIARAIKGLPPGEHELTLICPCPDNRAFPFIQVVEGTPKSPKPHKIDFSKLTPIAPAVVEK